jgi:hypothetical protein
MPAKTKLSGGSEFSQKTPKKWLREVWQTLCEEQQVYIDYRVEVKAISDEHTLMIIGGIWHIFAGRYLTKAEEKELGWQVSTVWWMNKPQCKLFSMIPLIHDPDSKIPPTYIGCRGGRRSGKTEGSVRLAMAQAVIQPYSVIACFGMDHKSNLQMVEKIAGIIPQNWISAYDRRYDTLHLRNGSKIIFFSPLNYRKAGRSYTFDCVLLDEFPTYLNSRAILEGVKGSIVERDGIIVAMYTPPPVHETAYWEEMRAKSPDPEVNKSVKIIYFGSTLDNEVLSEKAKRKALLQAKTMYKDQFEREFLGKWSRSSGVVFYDWKDEVHVLSAVPPEWVDITAEFNKRRVGREAPWIMGMDFNENPMTAAFWKLYWSPAGGHLVCHHELFENESNTEKFIHSKIFPFLRSQYPEIKNDRDLANMVFQVVDASAYWQGNSAGRTKEAVVVPATKYLISAGFRPVAPKQIVRGVHTGKDNKKRFGGQNPDRIDRMESARGRLMNRFGWPCLSFLENCVHIIESWRNIPLAGGKPDNRSEYAHFYDASSYPIYNLYPAVQLYDADPDHLTKTYTLVDKIGKECLTEEQRQAHPMVKHFGKELVL